MAFHLFFLQVANFSVLYQLATDGKENEIARLTPAHFKPLNSKAENKNNGATPTIPNPRSCLTAKLPQLA